MNLQLRLAPPFIKKMHNLHLSSIPLPVRRMTL